MGNLVYSTAQTETDVSDNNETNNEVRLNNNEKTVMYSI